MKTKFVKSMVAGVLGALLSGISLHGMNPVGMAAYGAIQGSSLFAVPTVPLFLIAGYMKYGFLQMVKYGIMMFLTAALLVTIKYTAQNKEKVNVYISALATSVSFGMMEFADAFMGQKGGSAYLVVLVSVIFVFSLTVVFGRLIEIFLGEDKIRYDHREKDREREIAKRERMAGAVEDKMKLMADSFERMSRSIDKFQSSATEPVYLEGEAAVVNGIWEKRFSDSRNAVALQLREMSDILKEAAAETYVFANLTNEKERELRIRLKGIGVLMKNVVVLNNRRGIDEVNIMIRAPKKNVIMREVADVIGKVMGKKVSYRKNPYARVTREYTGCIFVEEPNFFVIHGTAKHSGSDSQVCGDNFTCMELESGQTLLSVSDGMGQGVRACKDSEAVLELLEEMMQSGFQEETAVRLINSLFMVDGNRTRPAALDMGIIDMYSGICDFMKMGASSTFVKRGQWVEAIKSTSLPIGSTEQADIETATKKLYDGDFVIMMSDGILESIQSEDKEKTIGEIILGIPEGRPEDMAKEILKRAMACADRQQEDDMMVMVTGIWDKCA